MIKAMTIIVYTKVDDPVLCSAPVLCSVSFQCSAFPVLLYAFPFQCSARFLFSAVLALLCFFPVLCSVPFECSALFLSSALLPFQCSALHSFPVLCFIHQAVEVSEQIKDGIVISCVWLVALTIYGCMRRTRTLIEVSFIRMLHRHGDWRFRKKNSKHFVLLPLLLLLLELPLLEDEEPGFTKALAFTNLLLSSSHSGVGASRCDFTRALF